VTDLIALTALTALTLPWSDLLRCYGSRILYGGSCIVGAHVGHRVLIELSLAVRAAALRRKCRVASAVWIPQGFGREFVCLQVDEVFREKPAVCYEV
jgi:hypothetical protein